MYCPSCGKELPQNSLFCLYCGKPTNIPAITSTKKVIEWEYKDFYLTWKKGETGWVMVHFYSEPAAREYYWQNYQSAIMPKLLDLLDEGWQPLTEIGPSCIELREYKSLEGADTFGLLLLILASLGLALLFLPFSGSWKYQMVGFRLRLRRPKV